MKLARRLLQRRENQPHQLKVIEPPVEYLQEDISEALDQRLPAEVIYMLQNIRYILCYMLLLKCFVFTIAFITSSGCSTLKSQFFWNSLST